ncbi:arsenate reductase family protein [Maribacter sp. 2307ULW6-5]|uniref:arsenate reductase family protein n=1 Tax=Maribacter sp. 2307ULW6-5 TaxID=3386275 RepID=UPI0039BD0DCD
MKKIYHLGSCNTCQRILKELEPLDDFELQDIKTNALTPEQLEGMRALTTGYEALFSKRARLFRERNMHQRELTDTDYKNAILDHYTFLKRPVLVLNDRIFIGNSKKEVAAAKAAIHP